MISQNKLKSNVRYCSKKGIFYWIKTTNNSRNVIGSEAGYINKHLDGKRYKKVTIDGDTYYCHRLAFVYVYGNIDDNIFVDHIDGDGTNNSFENLRLVTKEENAKNRKLSKLNKTGVSGVRHRGMKWECNIRPNKKYIHLGTFSDFFEAVCARKSAEVKYGFHENHGTLRSL